MQLNRRGNVLTRNFWQMAGGVIAVVTLLWFALNYFDKTLAQARVYLSTEPTVAAEVGSVDGTTLYKLRYLDARIEEGRCFAEYYFFVSGARGAWFNVRVRACGDHNSPTFAWMERKP